ncbi:hypothetical protein F5J12DRAFT_224173 [Pisolithus orientalis]|uniref:uncharacterized protein n=1 Tax=Pisolithus orientalis TaxID=936130 RepID=UPI0022259C45|nr:uncharacterized protein F5J12DRAFT_224173 [Pisolithus orientalis]KAI6002223.1 hypothetical protein F5J12DRAFT_224173 [Pisolithus orientalis]
MGVQFDFRMMAFVAVASALSALAVGGVLIYIAYSAITIKPNASRRWSTDSPIHYYFLNLMISDLFLAIGGFLDIKWVIETRVYFDAACTVQGFFMQVGDVGVALSTMAIALHILQVLVLNWRSPPKYALFVLAIIWVVIVILVVAPNVIQHNINGPTGHWCWIERGIMEQIGLDYIWMWLAAILNIISYLFLILVIKRLVIMDGNRFRWRGRQERGIPYGAGTSIESVRANQMIFYPLVYIILVLPISAARFSKFMGHDVPFPVTGFAATLYASSGLINTILYTLTRPKLMPRRPSQTPKSVCVTIGRLATHDRFPEGYMVEDGSTVTASV